ncbi:MAG: hypothetical protein ACREE7_01155 [Dongiaceae bacterium]
MSPTRWTAERRPQGRTEVNSFPYKVRWIVTPLDPDRSGHYGTTTHRGSTPAAAALASAESVMSALSDDLLGAQMHILSVFAEDTGGNLLSADDLRLALRYHPKVLPVDVICRPLC